MRCGSGGIPGGVAERAFPKSDSGGVRIALLAHNPTDSLIRVLRDRTR
jgi:hypothetical protein